MNTTAPLTPVLIIGLLVQILMIIGVIWRGGSLVGRVNHTLEVLTPEIGGLRQTRDEQIGILARVVSQLDALESRVGRIEDRRSPRRRQE